MPTFPRTARLVRAEDFRNVFARPIRFGDELVTVLVRPNGLDEPRLGLAVGKRRISGAVRRNRFKRIVRERFRVWRERLGGHDIVVMPKPAAGNAAREALRTSIDRQWALIERRARSARDPEQ